MMIDRREFVVGAALSAVAPTLPVLFAPTLASATDIPGPVFMIHGWSVADEGTTDRQVWIRVGHSWRTAWR